MENVIMEREMKVLSAKREKPPRRKPKDYSCCMLYDSNAAMIALKGLSIAACNPSIEGIANAKIAMLAQQSANAMKVKVEKKLEHVVSDKMSCGYCYVEFAHRRDQRDHYKSDWHRYNLKRKIQGTDSITEDQFETMEGNLSSISGSESDSADTDTESDLTSGSKYKSKLRLILPQLRQRRSSASSTDSESEDSGRNYVVATRHAKVFFRNIAGEVISLYRCVLYHKKEHPADHEELLSMVVETTRNLNWLVLMAAGGHFAGAVFNKDQDVTYKTFHRYTVRARRGTAQGSWDSQGNIPKSAGATLRRYNEAALLQEVQDLMVSWSDYIEKADIIFMRAPGINKKLFFGGKNPAFKKDDPRIRMVPFQTRRPTYNELRRVREMLATVECYGHEADIEDFVPISPSRKFSAETGRLEIIPDDQTSVRSKKFKGKDKLGTSPLAAQSDHTEMNCKNEGKGDGPEKQLKTSLRGHVIHPEIIESSEASDCELVCITSTISTQELKEFDFTERHRKKKKKKVKRRRESESEDALKQHTGEQDEEKYHLRNNLYTACKIGDFDALKNILVCFNEMHIQETHMEKQHANVCKLKGVNCQFDCDTKKDDDVNCAGCVSSSDSFNHPSNDGIQNKFQDELKRTKEPNNSSTSTDNLTSDAMKSVDRDHVTDIRCAEFKRISQDGSENFTHLEQQSPVLTTSLLNELVGNKRETVLHVAAKSGHTTLVWLLMDSGADPTLRDNNGQTPYAVTEDKEVRNEFRRFMAKYPNKYQYEKSQIPGPLTLEMEAERKQKENERRKIQRKAKSEKLKGKKADDTKRKAEEEKKQKFLSMSDREKRAFAAERRLLEQQQPKPGMDLSTNSCCWQCGTDMKGKVPFEYYDYKFCTSKCLQQHRKKPSAI